MFPRNLYSKHSQPYRMAHKRHHQTIAFMYTYISHSPQHSPLLVESFLAICSKYSVSIIDFSVNTLFIHICYGSHGKLLLVVESKQVLFCPPSFLKYCIYPLVDEALTEKKGNIYREKTSLLNCTLSQI